MRPNRPKINPKLRNAVFKKYGGRCYYCGCKLTSAHNFELDHYVPFCAHGSSNMDNLVPSCNLCNKIKSCHTIDEFRKRLEEISERKSELAEKVRTKYALEEKNTVNFYYESLKEATFL